MSHQTVKILELCTSPGLGGLELYMAKTVQWFAARGVPCAAVISPNTRLAAWMQEHGVPHRILRRRSKLLPLIAARELARVIDDQEIDLIHIHWAKDLTLAVLAKTFCARRVRLAYSRHMKITRPKHDPYHRWLYSRVDLFLTATRQMLAEARANLPLDSSRITHNYLGAPRASGEADCSSVRHSLGLSADEFLIACVGRIEPGKMQHIVLQALERLEANGGDAHVAFVGAVFDEGYFGQLQKTVGDRRLDSRVHFTGFVAQPAPLMACADVVCLTTAEETFGLVLIEAMHLGVPVIGTAAGGVLEIIEDQESGLLVPPNDPDALAVALERLLRDGDLRKSLSEAGRNRAERLFDIESHYGRLIELFSNAGSGSD